MKCCFFRKKQDTEIIFANRNVMYAEDLVKNFILTKYDYKKTDIEKKELLNKITKDFDNLIISMNTEFNKMSLNKHYNNMNIDIKVIRHIIQLRNLYIC